MPAIQRIYLSTNSQEWWNGHLAKSLAGEAEIVYCPMARPGQQGHLVETTVSDLIQNGEEEKAFYLGSADQMFPGIVDLPMPTAIWTDYCAGGSFGRSCLPLFDVIFCTQKDSVETLKKDGMSQVEWLPFAFDPTLKNEPSLEKVYDVGFVGSLEQPATQRERVEILGRLEKRFSLNEYRRSVYGDEMMRVYNQSRIVVNIPVPGGFNMRTFEAMAAGALLLTKRVGNGQEELFKDGIHLVTYDGTEDLVAKVEYYLRNENERSRIATAGMQEVLAHHTYAHRAARVLAVMRASRVRRSNDPNIIASGYAEYYHYLGRPDLLGYTCLGRKVALKTRLRIAMRALWVFWRKAVGAWKAESETCRHRNQEKP